MNMENEPKTAQDYKDVVKILKLKIIKQNKRIQQLQLKNKTYEEQINSVTIGGADLVSSRAMIQIQNQSKQKTQQRELEMTTLKGKVDVMNLFVKGLQKIGITPQSVFRIADFAYKNYVEADSFREVLSKMKLGLSQKEISCLIFIFDESYAGFITREDYYNSLHAYKMGVENNFHVFIQESILKLSHMLHQDKANLIKFYEQMEGRSRSKAGNKKTIELNNFEEQIKKYFGGKISQREIVASFNAIDLQAAGYLEKNNFLYCVTSYINKLLSGEEIGSRKTQPEWTNNGKSQFVQPSISDPLKTTPKKMEKQLQNQQAAKNIITNPYTVGQGAISRLQNEFNLNLYSIYQQLINDDLNQRMTLKTFKKHILSQNSKIPSHLLSELFKEIDQTFKGSIFFNELINFYLTSTTDNEMILRLIGKYFHESDLDAQKFWFQFGLNSDAQISKAKFLESMRKTFESREEKWWQNIWNIFDKGRGTCNVGSIIKTFKKYQMQ